MSSPTPLASRRFMLASAIVVAVPKPAAPARAAESRGVEISVAPSSFKKAMTARDEAADFKCKGGVFDCDGDRREYARKQTQNFLRRSKGFVFGRDGGEGEKK